MMATMREPAKPHLRLCAPGVWVCSDVHTWARGFGLSPLVAWQAWTSRAGYRWPSCF